MTHRARRSLTLFGLLLVAALGCREAREPPAAELRDDIVSSAPLLLVPGLRWSHDEVWRFNNRGSILVWVREPVTEPLTIELQAAGEAGQFHFKVDWDGVELSGDEVREAPTGLAVTLPPASLEPGRHTLGLTRNYRRDKPEHRRSPENTFAAIGFRLGPLAGTVDPADQERQQRIKELLVLGAVGDREARGGVLFVGPARTDMPFAVDEPTVLTMAPQNFSDSSAVFRVAGGEGEVRTTVGAGAEGSVEVALSPGDHVLTLEVQGDADGLFLWSRPYLRRRATDLTPIFLITLDTTRRDALDPYSGAELTPHLARFARRATVYERAYSTAPWTLPSHASIFTGLYPSKHGAGVSEVQLPPGPTTLAERLRQRGYFTAGFSAGALSSSRFGLARGFHVYRNPDGFETPGDQVLRYVTELVERHAADPLFVFVNFFDAHALYRAPAPFPEKTGAPALAAKIRDVPVWGDMAAGEMEGWRKLVFDGADSPPEALAWMRAAYLAEVAYTDHLLGQLFKVLRQLDLYDRALIVIVADHGEHLGEQGVFSHVARLDPELVEIPLLVKWPDQRRGFRRQRLTSQVDLFPTLLAAAGIEPPPSDGRALAQGKDPSPAAPYLLLEEHASLVHPLPERLTLAEHLFAVQQPTFRQVVAKEYGACSRYRDGAWRDAPCTTERDAVLAAIERQLGRGAPSETAGDEVVDELREQLTALGYMASPSDERE